MRLSKSAVQFLMVFSVEEDREDIIAYSRAIWIK
jgi:hypothetical protein